MLEANQTFIENKNFMLKNDFFDIPGLNEYIKINEHSEQDNQNKKKNKKSL